MTYKGLSGFLAGSRGVAFWISQAGRSALRGLVNVKTDVSSVYILIRNIFFRFILRVWVLITTPNVHFDFYTLNVT